MTTRTKKLLSILLLVCMIVSMIPAVASAATPSKVYLKPNSNWTKDNARFAAYFFGNGETWVNAVAVDGGYYEVTVPSGYPSIIFCRMNPGTTANNWTNKWNQTADLTVPTDGTNCYTVKEGTWDTGGGSWSTINVEPEVTEPAESEPVTSEPAGSSDDYYLFGYINGEDYGTGDDYATLGKYKFVDGKLTCTFPGDSYVGVKTGDNKNWYMTKGWYGNVTSGVLYDTNVYKNFESEGYTFDKLAVPGGVELTFTLEVNTSNNTVTLSYVRSGNVGFQDETGIQNGVTLHAWNWSFNAIKDNMALIASQGYTAVQTSPIQPVKESTAGKDMHGVWWVQYQPVDFIINTATNNPIGTASEFAAMCAEAEKYGVQVIVDVVANHMANHMAGNTLSTAIPDYIRNDASAWHDYTKDTTGEQYAQGDRYGITQYCMGGVPDLNTGSDKVQSYVLKFLKECIAAGADGFRFDGAKHIETPDDDPSFASDFWPTVLGGAQEYAESLGRKVYFYGEVLDSPGKLPLTAYTKYMSVTDNSWGRTLLHEIASGNNNQHKNGYNKSANANQLVVWAECHDDFCTSEGHNTSGISVANVNKAWALIASRAEVMPLYFGRPANFYSTTMGTASLSGWNNAEVKAVNKFHTAFVGQSELVGNANNISVVVRGTTGIVLVNATGTSASVKISGTGMTNGTYKDQITGNTFTVSGGVISGKIGSTGIAVVYNANEVHTHSYTAVVTAPTCTAAGYTTYTCACGNSYVGNQVAALGHNYVNGTCSRCGAEDPNYVPPTEPEHKHSYSAVVTAPTCTAAGYTTYTCSCGDSYVGNQVAALGHNYVDGICSRCGAKDPNYVPPTEPSEGGYVQVTDIADITAGGQFVIVANNSGTYKALGTTISTKISAVNVTVSDGVVTGDNLPVWTVEAVSDGVALSVNGSYLSYKSSTDFKSATSAYAWNVKSGSNGGFVFNASTSTSRGIYYQISGDRFGAYAQSFFSSYVTELLVFKYVAGSNVPTEPSEQDYYLFGYINGANYGCEEDNANLGEYKFVNGKLTATFAATSYVAVKTGDNKGWYMTNGWQGEVTSVTLYNTDDLDATADKLMVPGGTEVTFTLVVNSNGTLTLSYTHKHSYSTEVTAPTCTTAGYTTYTCACGDSYVADQVSALGHDYVNGFCSRCGKKNPNEGEPDILPPTLTARSFSLSFEDEILVNYYYTVSDTSNVVEQGMLVFYTNPAVVDITLADDVYKDSSYVEASGRYMNTTKGIAAKEMGDSRYYVGYAKLSDGTYAYAAPYEYSPKKYAMNMLGKSTTSAEQKALCVAMLNYGAAAQNYFKHNTNNLMNNELTADQKALVVAYNRNLFTGAVAAPSSKIGAFTRSTTGFSSRNATVSFEGAFVINYYFTPNVAVEGDVTFYYWNPADYAGVSVLKTTNATGTCKMVNSNGTYFAQVTGVPAKEVDSTYYVAGVYTGTDGNTYCTGVIAYSLSRYCMNNDSGDMAELAQATAMYGYYAEALLNK